MNITDNFTWEDVTETNTGIENNLPDALRDNAQRQAELLESCRVFVGPLRVNSWYRSSAVNKAVGGEKTSYHQDALATDVVPHGDVFKAFKMLVAAGLDYDKIIYEKRNSEWIHIQSPQPHREPRRQAFTAHKDGAGMVYEAYVS